MSKLSADQGADPKMQKGSIIADAETVPPASTSNGEPQNPFS